MDCRRTSARLPTVGSSCPDPQCPGRSRTAVCGYLHGLLLGNKGAGSQELQLIVAHGGRDRTVLSNQYLATAIRSGYRGTRSSFRRAGRQRSPRGSYGISPRSRGGSYDRRNPNSRRSGRFIAALHLSKNSLLPVHIVILGFFLALAGQFLQDCLSVLDGRKRASSSGTPSRF